MRFVEVCFARPPLAIRRQGNLKERRPVGMLRLLARDDACN
jgi:hypothetical protein